MTRVLLLAQQLRRAVSGGVGTYVRGLAQGLCVGEPEVTLYASRPPSGAADPLSALGHPLRCSRLPTAVMTKGWDVGLLDVPGGYPVVHAAALDTPPCRRSAMVVTVHDLAFREVPHAFSPRGRRWHEAAFTRALHRARAFVVPAEAVARAVIDAGASPSAVEVIPHGSDHLPPADAVAVAAADKVIEALGVTGPFVLAVGTLEPRKNLPRLIEAYARARDAMARDTGTRVSLVIVGPRGWGRALPEVGLPDDVRLAGPVPPATLAGLYRRALALAFVPLLEGFGLPALEAMAIGTAVLASPMPSTGDAALEVDPMDLDAIAGGLVRLSGDPTLRKALQAAGLERARQLTWAASAAAHVKLWERLA